MFVQHHYHTSFQDTDLNGASVTFATLVRVSAMLLSTFVGYCILRL